MAAKISSLETTITNVEKANAELTKLVIHLNEVITKLQKDNSELKEKLADFEKNTSSDSDQSNSVLIK